jgi:hypothetical protein
MHFKRSWLALFVVILLAGVGTLGAVAQDATPTPGTTMQRQPSQYAFYPSQVAQPGGRSPR